MGTLLVVGKIEDPGAEEAAVSAAQEVAQLPKNWLGRIKKSEIPWLTCPPGLREIECLNIASVTSFLRHAAELEGISVESRLAKTKWPQFPDYEQTYWIPVDFGKPKVVTPQGGFPVAIASAQALIRDLDDVRRVSPHSLGTEPASFGSDFEGTLDPAQTLQWIWLALSLGAREAVARNAPLAIG